MWRAQPVFVSSTFLDMQAERDHLRTRVFPELEERLRAKHVHLEWVDLRLGIVAASQTDEATRELQVLKVCLAEIRRCRPFFIVLLGDRYGWVPPPDRLATAAQEEGLGSAVAGCSVTEVEVRVGLQSPKDDDPRCFFYFRAPLPYEEMPASVTALYADVHDLDPAGSEQCERLAGMKQRIQTAFPDRVRHYAVEWDAHRCRVTGLEAWGRIVLEDLWRELAPDTAATEAEISWHQAERNALDDFVVDRARDFVGRERMLAYLTRLATSSPTNGIAHGACVTGDPGSGKSALFGELYRRLRETDSLVLAHATEASPQSRSVDSMLRRFNAELSTELGADAGPAVSPDGQTPQKTFASLLGKLARRRPVVVLLDGLDAFEGTPAERLLTWLPRRWPANARLVATAVPGDGSRTLAERSGIETVALPPLDGGEARHIAKAVCARYHRALEPDVLAALVAKTGPSVLACASPLWLVRAVEELNLLDADDFARARTAYSGSPAERLRSLMLDVVDALPADILSLYGVAFERAQELFGTRFARAFLALIGSNRAGWRESDFRALIPELSGESWDALRFAALRRLFRGQVRQRGTLGQWAFNCSQMRVGVAAFLAAAGESPTRIHEKIADHLLSLGPDDPVCQTEVMTHLLGSDDWRRVAAYFADGSLNDEAIQNATRVLAERLLAAPEADSAAYARTVTRLLDDMGSGRSVRLQVARRCLYFLTEALDGRAVVDAQIVLIRRITEVLEELLAASPGNVRLLTDLSVSENKTGRLLKAAGHPEAALAAYQEALTTFEALAAGDEQDPLWQHGLSLSHQNIGDLLFDSSRLEEALTSYGKCLAIAEKLAETETMSVEWQLDLASSHERVGRVFMATGRREEALEAYQTSNAILIELIPADPQDNERRNILATSFHGLGKALASSGRREQALASYTEALAIAETLAAEDPEDDRRRRDLSVSYERIGELHLDAGEPGAAHEAFEKSLTIRERIAEADPGNAEYQRDLANGLERMGDTYGFLGRVHEALDAYRRGISILEDLVDANRGNRALQRGLSLSQLKLGDALAAIGRQEEALATIQESHARCLRVASKEREDARLRRQLSKGALSMGDILDDLGRRDEALARYRESLAISEGLAAADADNSECQTGLAVALNRVGNVLTTAGRGEEALVAYRRSLAIMKKLAAGDPENAMLRFNIGIGHERIGNLLCAERPEEAFDEYRAQTAIYEGLIASQPGESTWRDGLLESCMRLRDLLASEVPRVHSQSELMLLNQQIGDIHSHAGRLEAALEAYRQQLTIAEVFARADPDDFDRKRSVSVAHSAIGRVLGAMGRGKEALTAFRQDLVIAEAAAATNPDDLDRQHDLSISYNQVGDVLLATNRFDDALIAFRKSVDIREKLVAEQPDRLRWLRGLVVSYNRVASALIGATRHEEALVARRQALAIAIRLAVVDPENADWRLGLTQSQKAVDELLRVLGR